MIQLLGRTLLLAFCTSLASSIVGAPLGLILRRTDLPWRKFWIVLLTFPLLLPPYILAMSWKTMWPSLDSLMGCVFILTLSLFPIVLWLTMLGVQQVPASSEEAGLLLKGWRGVVRKITLPAAAPSVLAGALLVFILSVSEFGVPSFFRWDTLTVAIFIRYAAFSDWAGSLRACLPLIPVVLTGLWLEFRLLHGKSFALSRASRPVATIPLGPWRWPVEAVAAAIAFLASVVHLLAWMRGAGSWTRLQEGFWAAKDSLMYSILYSSLGATGLTAFGFCMGYIIQRAKAIVSMGADAFVLLLFAVPSATLGILQITLWNRSWTASLYRSAWPLIIAYLLQYLAIPARLEAAHFRQIPRSWEESSFLSGLKGLRHFHKILWPLSRRATITAWILSWVFCIRDLGLTLLLYPPGHQTLTVRLFTLMPNSPVHVVSVMCLVIVGITLAPMIGALWALRSLRFQE